MTSILEELWGKVQEYQKEILDKKIQGKKLKKLKPQTLPERRSGRIKQLLKNNVNDALSTEHVAFNFTCINELCSEPVNMERETVRNASACDVDGETRTAVANLTADTSKEETNVADELECSDLNTSSSNNDASSTSKRSKNSDDSKSDRSTTEQEASEDTSRNSTSTSTSRDATNSEHSDSFQTLQASTSQEFFSAASEPDSSAALGILNQLSEELCCLNRDGASLTTSRHDSKRSKSGKTKKTPTKTSAKIKFNFKTPTKSPSRLSSATGNTNKATFSRSLSRSPFRFGYKTPTRSGQRTGLTHTVQSHGRKSVKRKVLHNVASPKRKKS